MVTCGQEYNEKGVDAREQQRAERTHTHLVHKASAFGYGLIRPAEGDIPTAAVTTA